MGEKAPAANACAFPTAPTAYEGPKDRSLNLQAMDLAAFNMIAPGNGFFGLPRLEKGLRAGAQQRRTGHPADPLEVD